MSSKIIGLTVLAMFAVGGCAMDGNMASAPTRSSVPAKNAAGYVTEARDGRLWVFLAESKEYTDFKAKGEPAQVVTRIGEGPGGMSLRSVNGAVIDGYLLSKEGFATEVRDGRLWVFKVGSKEYLDFKAKGEPAQIITRIGEGPNGMSLRSVDMATIDAYLQAKS